MVIVPSLEGRVLMQHQAWSPKVNAMPLLTRWFIKSALVYRTRSRESGKVSDQDYPAVITKGHGDKTVAFVYAFYGGLDGI